MRDRSSPCVCWGIALILSAGAGSGVRADVLLFENRLAEPVDVTLLEPGGTSRALQIPPRDLITIPLRGQQAITFQREGKAIRFDVHADRIYYFDRADGGFDLFELDFGGPGNGTRPGDGASEPDSADEQPGQQTGDRNQSHLALVPVKILVDDDEPATQRLWEQRLRARVEAASKIFEKYCRVRFEVVATGTWESDDQLLDMNAALTEFVRSVSPGPAQLAIGFTGQHQLEPGPTHLGSTRGALQSHLLIREWHQGVSEAERLEVLVHEMGHFLGAAHSPSPASVMRPVLGDQQARRQQFRLRFDAINTLIMCHVAEDIRRGVPYRLSETTVPRLAQLYNVLREVFPEDPAAGEMHRQLGIAAKASLAQAVAEIVAAIGAAGEQADSRETGDALTERLVRAAARAAANQPGEIGPRALLIGLGVTLADVPPGLPTRAGGKVGVTLPRDIKSALARRTGQATMFGRRDLTQHFFASAYLAALLGDEVATSAGLAKELLDSQTGSGFSFADLAADYAGIAFARSLLEQRLKITTLAENFLVSQFVPPTVELREGLTATEFAAEFGSTNSDRFRADFAEIKRNVERLQSHQRTLPYQAEIAFAQLEWTGWDPVNERGQVQQFRPLVLTHANDESNRIFVATQRGVIHVFPNTPDARRTKVFLDLSHEVAFSKQRNEEGMLGLAFHPDYEATGEFFVYYTSRQTPHLSIVSRFHVSNDDPDRADVTSEQQILRIQQPYWNHNGGSIAFGPDGYLYIGLGDGGGANDPHGNGQSLSTLLGSILRIDVDHKSPGKNYAIPPDNPFVNAAIGARGEIWARGLRNVWRLAFDRETGLLWAADVGQDRWEEVNIIRRGGNYGWNLREGAHAFGGAISSSSADLIDPIWEYDHEAGKSITGGYVYRGKRHPELFGAYLYADYVTGRLWALRFDERQGKVVSNTALGSTPLPIASFGEDAQGEVYMLVLTNDGHGIYQLEHTP